MYDIEVINNKSYAIINEGSPAYEFLKAIYSKMVVKKLSSEPGCFVGLTLSELVGAGKGFKAKDIDRLIDVGLIFYDNRMEWNDRSTTFDRHDHYTFTEYGLEVMKFIKDKGGDIEILL